VHAVGELDVDGRLVQLLDERDDVVVRAAPEPGLEVRLADDALGRDDGARRRVCSHRIRDLELSQ
jgi:hypothetical protein